MRSIRYSRYTGEDLGISAEDLLQALSDFLLESGFNTQYMPFSEWNQHTLEDLKKAIQDALEQGQLFSDENLQEMMERLQNMSPEQMDKLLDRLVQKMVDEGQITIPDPGEQPSSGAGAGDGKDTTVKFEVTDKSLDFLGFKTLKDLLGSLGKSSFGRHDTRDLATGIEKDGLDNPTCRSSVPRAFIGTSKFFMSRGTRGRALSSLSTGPSDPRVSVAFFQAFRAWSKSPLA